MFFAEGSRKDLAEGFCGRIRGRTLPKVNCEGIFAEGSWLKAGPACGLDAPSLGSSASITPPQLKNSVRLQLLRHVILNSCSVRPIRSKSLRAPIFLKRCSSAWVIQALGE